MDRKLMRMLPLVCREVRPGGQCPTTLWCGPCLGGAPLPCRRYAERQAAHVPCISCTATQGAKTGHRSELKGQLGTLWPRSTRSQALAGHEAAVEEGAAVSWMSPMEVDSVGDQRAPNGDCSGAANSASIIKSPQDKKLYRCATMRHLYTQLSTV
jgi:hypothetical protein